MSSRFALLQHLGGRRSLSTAAAAKPSDSLLVDPATLVHGVTREKFDAEPKVAEYILANFPDAFKQDEITERKEDGYVYLDPETYERVYPEFPDTTFVKRKKIVYPRNIRPITTYRRDPVRDDGTKNSKRLRYFQNMIPGLLYGSDTAKGIFAHEKSSKIHIKTHWPVLERELDKYRWNFESRVYDVTVLDNPESDPESGTTHRVIPKDVQRHPVKSTIYCCNFVRYHPLRSIPIPVRYINEEESPALRRNAFMLPITRHIDCLIEEGADIPECLDVECTGLERQDVVRQDRIIMPEGVQFTETIKARPFLDFVIGVVDGGGRGDEDEEEEGEAADGQKDAAKEDNDKKDGKKDKKGK